MKRIDIKNKMKKMNGNKTIAIIMLLMLLSVSCNKPVTDVTYLQDAEKYGIQPIEKQTIFIKNNDQLQISVTDEKPILVEVFKQQQTETEKGLDIYLVDNDGNIIFPVFGAIEVAGKTCREVSELIRQKIIDGGISKNPVVSVRIANFSVTVLGEVNHPGRYDVPSGRITVLDAIAMAGDLTITGKRDRVLVVREMDGKRSMVYVSLLSTDLLNSPYYHLRQNDIIYVEPNNLRQKQSTGMETLKWTAGVSLFISLSYFVLRILGK